MIDLTKYHVYEPVTEKDLDKEGLYINYNHLSFSENKISIEDKKFTQRTEIYRAVYIGRSIFTIPQGNKKKFIMETKPIKFSSRATRTDILKSLLDDNFKLTFILNEMLITVESGASNRNDIGKKWNSKEVYVNGINQYSLPHDSKEYKNWFVNWGNLSNEEVLIRMEWRYLLSIQGCQFNNDILINHLVDVKKKYNNERIQGLSRIRQ